MLQVPTTKEKDANLLFRLGRNNALLAHLGSRVLLRCNVLELVERFKVHVLAEDVTSNPPGKHFEYLVVHVCPGWHRKDVVEFLKSALLGFGNPEVDHDQCSNVQTPM